ncbi:MAG: 16S rRNA pseudouridine516 synthase [Bermanella sp.]|jgi:16S rRNA pseudouridine516 synthase|uniref:pseudouridine synthase n=1 Tax=Glaciecola sp. 33A TaxID=2057807 RepID=UPI000C331ED5|nr:pseudouridine synthase [Glaciecola sp. 33A]PKI00132.1 16S rRNA pseudouridine(516) synthase [Glaciecola sp. 33A]
MRLDKFVCKSTQLSKSHAIRCINAGEVVVNDKVTTDEATQVHENNTITLNGMVLKSRQFRYILMHKPANTICSNIDEVYPSIFNYLHVEKITELHIAGRLDADTTGLILITDDGRWSYSLTAPANQCPKVYRVNLSKELKADVASAFEKGVQLQGEKELTLPARLENISLTEVLLTITEGKFHQVKRMFASVGNRVVSLHREKIGDIYLDVAVGQWRYLSDDEVQSFKR